MAAEELSQDGALGDELTAFRARLDEFRSQSQDRPLEPDTLMQELESAHEELRVADEEVRTQQAEIIRLSRRAQAGAQDRLIAALPAAALVTDEHGMVRSANATAAQLLRLDVEHLLTKSVFSFLDRADRPELRRRLASAVASGEGIRRSITVRPRTAEAVTVDLSATVTQAPGEPAQLTWILLPARPEPAGARPAQLPLPRALAELTRLNVQTSDTGALLTEVARLCENAFPARVFASISLGPPLEPTLVATGSKTAQQVDGAQHKAQEGPCQASWEEGRPVLSEDIRGDDRWPRLTHAIADLPVRAVSVHPLRLGDDLVGALQLYDEDGHLATEAARADVELLAISVAAILHENDLKAELRTLADQLRQAMQSRACIEQAKGLLMAVYQCTPDEAFAKLAKMSSERNVKLRVLAERLVGQASTGSDSRGR